MTIITTFPENLDDASRSSDATSEFRLGGTDLQARLRRGTSSGRIVDLTRVPGLVGVRDLGPDGVEIGAATTIAAVASHPLVQTRYPALALTARGLATPQVRAVGSIGGNLLQKTRCWYLRGGHACFKSGGDTCPARTGNHLYGVAIDQGPCVAPHPSSIGAALLVYDTIIRTHTRSDRPVAELWGDGSDPTRDHLLGPDEIVTLVLLPRVPDGERGGYFRSISRFEAEWPLVEAVVRLHILDGRIKHAGVAVGGVANTPLRLPEVEQELLGELATDGLFESASRAADHRCRPLPQTGYKAALLGATISEALRRAAG